MKCAKCNEENFDKLTVINAETKLNVNIYTNAQWESILSTIKCLSCGCEFEEEI